MKISSTGYQAENPDIKQLSLDILRDVFSASRQLKMYPLGHPLTNDTLKKPLEKLNLIFSFKCSFVLQVYNKRLVAEGLLLENNVFVDGIVTDLIKHNINTLEISSHVQIGDLYHLLVGLLERKNPDEDFFKKYLNVKNIKTIRLNNPKPPTIFEFEESLLDIQNVQFYLNDQVKNLIKTKPDLIAAVYLNRITDEKALAGKLGLDLRLGFLRGRVRSFVSSLSQDEAMRVFNNIIYSTNWLGDNVDDDIVTGMKMLWQDYSKNKHDVGIFTSVYELFKSVGAPHDIVDSIFDEATLVKLRAVRETEEMIEHLKNNQGREVNFDSLNHIVRRLAADQHIELLKKLSRQLVKGFNTNILDMRQRSLRLLIGLLEVLSESGNWEIYTKISDEVLRGSLSGKANPEVIELIGWLAERSAEKDRWHELKTCVQTLNTIAGTTTSQVDTEAASVLAKLSESSVMNDILIDAILKGKGGKNIFETIQIITSKKIIQVLLEKIDDENMSIRTRVIKALSLMGEKAGEPINQSVAMIAGAGETEDETTWHKLRNYLRVLGQIRYMPSLPYFKILSKWNQPRVKLEIISACETMQSAQTAEILTMMAFDNDKDVRKAAVVAMGMSNHPDMLPSLKRLFKESPYNRDLVVGAMGRIGGNVARDQLIEYYENEDIYSNLGINKKEEEKIKVAILKSLANIGDDLSRSRIALYSKSGHSTFFKKDILSETAIHLIGGEKPDSQ